MDVENAVLADSLALLSLKVALQVDRKLGGKEIDLSAFSTFGDQLSKATGVSTSTPATSSFLQADPAASELLARAIWDTSQQHISNTGELVDALSSMVVRLKSICSLQPSTEELSQVKLFCLALHRSMMSQKLPPSREGDYAFEEQIGIFG